MRSVTGLCALLGSTVGGFVPALWGDTGFFSLASLAFSALGGVAGVLVGARLSSV